MERPAAPAEAGKPPLSARPLMGNLEADELARLFKMLASDTRLRLLHALERAGEMCVTDLAAELGMAPQAVSNQLQRLRALLGQDLTARAGGGRPAPAGLDHVPPRHSACRPRR
jgi:ArsR family transcriptional regulator, lead/cadmium/zinc/bismuth-responsive transcriptional repressor